MIVVLGAFSAAAPPWASTDALTRSTPDCAAAGSANAAPNISATVGTTIRNMTFSLEDECKHIGLRRPLSRGRWKCQRQDRAVRPQTAWTSTQRRRPKVQ